MNDLEKYFYNNKGHLIHKWIHYFEIYDGHFQKFRNKEVNILEIGVTHGGSLQMWKNYFGEKAKIYGIDTESHCKNLEEENIEIFIGLQSDRKFLREIKEKIPPIDILIDDGGHYMNDQIVTFEELFGHIQPNGVYVCEDLYTSYQLKYGGGHKRRGTFIEYTKIFVDYINAFQSEENSLKVNSFTETVQSVHYYNQMILIEKREMQEPFHRRSGNKSFERGMGEKNF